MKYLFIVKNYATLCRALRYTADVYGKENCEIVFFAKYGQVPEKILSDFSIRQFDTAPKGNAKPGTASLQQEVKICMDETDRLFGKTQDDFTVVVFNDSVPARATYLDKVVRKYGKRVHVTLMEEGTALYMSNDQPDHFLRSWKRKIRYAFLGFSAYAAEKHPVGMHPAVEKIIASLPEALADKAAGRNITLEKEIEIFTPEFSRYYVEAVLGYAPDQMQYDFIFLTQPVLNDLNSECISAETLDAFYRKLTDLTPKYGRMLIKNHPRDKTDYSIYARPGVDVCSREMQTIPFECLLRSMKKPALLSFFSTVSSGEAGLPIAYLYPLVGLEAPGALNDEFFSRNHIARIDSFEKLERFLSELQEGTPQTVTE